MGKAFEEALTQEELKKYIFFTVGITDPTPWADKTVPEIMAGLRESAFCTLQELGEESGGLSAGHVLQTEKFSTLHHVKKLLPALKRRLDARMQEGWLIPGQFAPNPSYLKKYFFSRLGMTDTAVWEKKSITQILIELRDNVGWALTDAAEALGRLEGGKPLTPERVRQLENEGTEQAVKRLVSALEPRLRTLAHEGWLRPENFTIDETRYQPIVNACRDLRMARHMSNFVFDKALTKKGLTHFHSAVFEKTPQIHANGTPRTFGNFLDIVKILCSFYDCSTPAQLLQKAKEAREYNDLQYLPAYDRKTRDAIGDTVGAVLEFLGVEQRCLTDAGLFKYQNRVSHFIKHVAPLSPEKIQKIPAIIMHAFEQKNAGQQAPDTAYCITPGQMLEKGQRLMRLNKEHLRAAVVTLFEEQAATFTLLAEKTGIKAETISGFISGKKASANMSTHYIHKLGIALGVSDIFALEKMGKPPSRKKSPPVVGAFSANTVSKKSAKAKSESRE